MLFSEVRDSQPPPFLQQAGTLHRAVMKSLVPGGWGKGGPSTTTAAAGSAPSGPDLSSLPNDLGCPFQSRCGSQTRSCEVSVERGQLVPGHAGGGGSGGMGRDTLAAFPSNPSFRSDCLRGMSRFMYQVCSIPTGSYAYFVCGDKCLTAVCPL